MIAKLKLAVAAQQAAGHFDCRVAVYDDANNLLYEIKETYVRANAIYAAYKTFQKAINKAVRYGIAAFTIETNHRSFAAELGGTPNVNKKLLNATLDRLERENIAIEAVIYRRDS